MVNIHLGGHLFDTKEGFANNNDWLLATLSLLGGMEVGKGLLVHYINQAKERFSVTVTPKTWSYPVCSPGGGVGCSLKVDGELLGAIGLNVDQDGAVYYIYYDTEGNRLDRNAFKDVLITPFDFVLFYKALMETVYATHPNPTPYL